MFLYKKDLTAVLAILAQGREVFVPGTDDGVRRFVPWQGGLPELSGENTALPPKDILFPKTEKMYSFRLGSPDVIEEAAQTPERVIFGLRPCDVHSVMCLDAVFLGGGYEDGFYARRRERCLLIAAACRTAGESCFCESMGLSPNDAPGADILLREAEDGFFVKALSARGETELAAWGRLLHEGDFEPGNTRCTLAPTYAAAADRLPELFENAALWRRFSDPCLKCGVCAFVCPTCYCFDIQNNDVRGAEGTAFRCWDSCMFSDYNQNAGGHNSRPTALERLRNRYMHKLSYFRERHGMPLCSGCGRCIGKCPAHLDITEFISAAAEVLK